MDLATAFPNPEDLLALEPEELAGYLLADLNSRGSARSRFHRTELAYRSNLEAVWADKNDACQHALMEALTVLEHEVMVARDPGDQHSYFFITRRGQSVRSPEDYDSFRHARLFPRGAVHPSLEQGIYPHFLRGDYETAIFKAFKQVEVAVRSATPALNAKLYGVDLMRKAFNPDNGPLTDTNEPVAECEALQSLFAGAIGRFKNPTSHRHVPVTSPEEAIEALLFASHLLRVVDDRAP